MSAKITTAFGHAVPPAPRHAVTAHMPGWQTVERYSVDARSIIKTFYNAYPRAKPHRDIMKLDGYDCFLFSSLESATECLHFATSAKREDGTDKDHVPSDAIFVRAFKADDYFWAVIFAEQYFSLARGFWSRPGVGISSRFAEANLVYSNQLKEVDVFGDAYARNSFDTTEHEHLRERIVSHLSRACQHEESLAALAPSDVYLFPSGMASIYKPHVFLSSLYHGKTILFGMAFMDTVVALEEYGAGFKFLGLGSDDDLLELDVYLREQRALGQKVQAIWAEFPANPILVTPDLVRLRALADEHDVLLAIDDTISGFANVDILHMVDFLVTSLTKSFNGYADVIAGSVVLNPSGRHYSEIKTLFTQRYTPELYIGDVKTLLRNNEDYLKRTSTLNHNAKKLVEYLHKHAEDPSSAISRVHYPSINSSGKHYTQFVRKTTPDLAPGYGCLFSVELEDIATTVAFYNSLNVHNSVHLGAPFTLAFAYTMCTYGQRLDWAAKYDLRPTQIRITAGLEDTEVLLKDFQNAIDAANLVKSRRTDPKSEFQA